MGAIRLSGARIGCESIVGAGALVTGGTVVPARSFVLGLPGRVVRRVTDEEWLSVRDTARRCFRTRSRSASRDPSGGQNGGSASALS